MSRDSILFIVPVALLLLSVKTESAPTETVTTAGQEKDQLELFQGKYCSTHNDCHCSMGVAFCSDGVCICIWDLKPHSIVNDTETIPSTGALVISESEEDNIA